jgi:hypothetical protein
MSARVTALVAAAGLLAMASMSKGSAAQGERELGALAEQKSKIAADLAATVRQCVVRKDTGHAAFHGCIDWHSAAHGTWALVAYGRMTGDGQDAALIVDALQPAKLAAERELLQAQPGFEMPYGRAWFLRLAIEHKAASGGDLLKPMADDVLASMLDYYRGRRPDPRRGSYASDSWALINMLDYAAVAGNGVALEQVRGLVRNNFIGGTEGCDYGLEAGHFMAVCTNWAWLVSKVMGREEFSNWSARFFARIGLPPPVTRPVNWHHHGLNFSRAWGLWGLYAASARSADADKYLEAYVAHVRQAYDRPQLWRGSYEGVGHWVPQFGLFALQPLFGLERGR